MATMKRFIKYLIWVILFYFLSNILIYVGLRQEYRNLALVSNEANSPVVEIKDAEATRMNGKISGKVENNTNSFISTKYIKVDLFSKRGINLGTEYYKISGMETGTEKDFDIDFRVDNVEKYSVSIVDTVDYDPNADQFIILPNLTPSERMMVYMTAVVLMWG